MSETFDEREAIAQCQVTPVDTKWGDTNKAFEGEPLQIRSRFKSDDRPGLLADSSIGGVEVQNLDRSKPQRNLFFQACTSTCHVHTSMHRLRDLCWYDCQWRTGDVMSACFFEASVLCSEFHFFKSSEFHKFSRQQVDKTAFFNDQNCYWQSICSGEIVQRASFSDGTKCFRSHFWWPLNFHDLFVTRHFSGIVVLQHSDVLFFEKL